LYSTRGEEEKKRKTAGYPHELLVTGKVGGIGAGERERREGGREGTEGRFDSLVFIIIFTSLILYRRSGIVGLIIWRGVVS